MKKIKIISLIGALFFSLWVSSPLFFVSAGENHVRSSQIFELSQQQVEAEDITLLVSVYVDDDAEGIQSLNLHLNHDGMLLKDTAWNQGDYLDADGNHLTYCFDDGVREGISAKGMPEQADTATFSTEDSNIMWKTGYWADETGCAVLLNPELPFVTFEIQIPKGTPNGNYPLSLTDSWNDILGQEQEGAILDASGKKYSWYCNEVVIKIADTEPIEEYLSGDVNGDGMIDSDDAVICLKHANAEMLGEVLLSGDAFTKADFNADGVVDADDCVAIIRYANQQMLDT